MLYLELDYKKNVIQVCFTFFHCNTIFRKFATGLFCLILTLPTSTVAQKSLSSHQLLLLSGWAEMSFKNGRSPLADLTTNVPNLFGNKTIVLWNSKNISLGLSGNATLDSMVTKLFDSSKSRILSYSIFKTSWLQELLYGLGRARNFPNASINKEGLYSFAGKRGCEGSACKGLTLKYKAFFSKISGLQKSNWFEASDRDGKYYFRHYLVNDGISIQQYLKMRNEKITTYDCFFFNRHKPIFRIKENQNLALLAVNLCFQPVTGKMGLSKEVFNLTDSGQISLVPRGALKYD